MWSPFLFLSLLLALATTSLAQFNINTFETTACSVGQIAFVTAAGVGGCGPPSAVFSDPTLTRCDQFSYTTTTNSVQLVFLGPVVDTLTSACSGFSSPCPQSYQYPSLNALGSLLDVPVCTKDPSVSDAVAQASCERVGGTFVPLTGICLTPTCPATGCLSTSANCVLVTNTNAENPAAPCTEPGSICLNFNFPLYSSFSCGVPCGALACYDVNGVQVCNVAGTSCNLCIFGTRLDATTCLGPPLGSQAPQRRRDRLLRERKARVSRQHALCPAHLTACSVGFGRNGGYECLDTENELESCGGCQATGLGADCSALIGVRLGAVTCDRGRCVVSACRAGFKLRDGRCL